MGTPEHGRKSERPNLMGPDGHAIDSALQEYATDKLHMPKWKKDIVGSHLLANGEVCQRCQEKVTTYAHQAQSGGGIWKAQPTGDKN